MNRLALLAVVLVLGVCGTAEATTITGENLSLPYQRWVDESRMPTPDVTLTVVETPECPLADARACTAEGTNTIWFDPGLPPRSRREVFLHEMGHNFDYDDMADESRARFISYLHVPRPWGLAVEDFAGAYAVCAMGRVGTFFDPRIARRTCPLIRRVGG